MDHEALINASQMLRRKLELLFPDILAIADGQNVWYESFDQMSAIQQEAIAISQNGKFSSMISVFGLSSIIQQPVFSHWSSTTCIHCLIKLSCHWKLNHKMFCTSSGQDMVH